jgi:hypothetical protein
MQPDKPNDEERQEQLPQDGQTPFSAADPNPDPTGNTTDPVVSSTGSDLPIDHPATDTNVDPQELYDEGVAGAAEVSDKTAENAVTGYEAPDPATDINAPSEADNEDDTSNNSSS